jgi:hypothetical protein
MEHAELSWNPAARNGTAHDAGGLQTTFNSGMLKSKSGKLRSENTVENRS